MVTQPLSISLESPLAQQALAETEGVIRSHSRTFYFATALLPQAARRAVRSLYAFCRATDDLVDQDGATWSDLEAWRAAVARPAHQQSDPLLLSWSLVREHYQIDRRYETELIDGVGLDLRHQRFGSWAELERYCYLVASTVGLLSMPIIGVDPASSFEQARPYAIRLGVALQLTNILRDVGEDAASGRVYFPLDELAAFGLTDVDVLRGVYDDRFRALMRFQIDRAHRLYEEALPGIALLSRGARPAVGAAARLYRAILDEIEAIDYRVHQQRAHTSGWKKIRMLPAILVQMATLKR